MCNTSAGLTGILRFDPKVESIWIVGSWSHGYGGVQAREQRRLHRRAAPHSNSGELHWSGARRHRFAPGWHGQREISIYVTGTGAWVTTTTRRMPAPATSIGWCRIRERKQVTYEASSPSRAPLDVLLVDRGGGGGEIRGGGRARVRRAAQEL
jgi:hypothetical protein